MQLTNTPQPGLAVLIDAENAQGCLFPQVHEHIALGLGTPIIQRAYGDWTSPYMKSWLEQLAPMAIEPVHIVPATKGKNASDMALAIDAMDLLHHDAIRGIVICSSDSDFARLATRIRAAGKSVFGVGEQKTPLAFVRACDQFIHTEQFRPVASEGEKSKVAAQLCQAARLASAPGGFASLAAVGQRLLALYPDFTPQAYGFKGLGEMAQSLNIFEIEHRKSGSSLSHMYVRPLQN